MKRIGVLLIMGFLSFIFGCNTAATDGRYISEAKFNKILSTQTTMTPDTLKQLHKYGVKDETNLKLEYFFYTNTAEKAAALAKVLEEKKYSVEYGVSADDKKIYVVTGWTDKMSMNEQTVLAWTKQMCEVGYENDCEFDGWGTNPEQK